MTFGLALPLRLTGGYIHNLSATPNTYNNSKENVGSTADLQIGRITEAGTWEIGGSWRQIEADATLGQFVESEFASLRGNTDIKGWSARINYSPWRNVTIGASAYQTSGIGARNIPDRTRAETTMGVKF